MFDGVTPKTHKNIPFLLVSNSRQPSGDLVLVYDVLQSCNRLVLGVHCFSKCKVARGVFVTIVYDGIVRKSGKVCESGIHLSRSSLEESTATSNEQGVSREDTARLLLVGAVSHIVTNGIPSVTGSCQTSISTEVQGNKPRYVYNEYLI